MDKKITTLNYLAIILLTKKTGAMDKRRLHAASAAACKRHTSGDILGIDLSPFLYDDINTDTSVSMAFITV